MANTLANLARMYTETTGTGTLTLTTAVPGFNTLADAGVASGSTITYAIYCGPHREIGAGVYTASGLTLTRATVYSSTNGGAKISLTGRSEVFIAPAKEDFDTFLTTAAAATTYQPLDGDLTALAALTGTNTLYYRSGADTWSAVTVNATLGFSGGTLGGSLASNYQPLDSELSAIAGLTSAADRLPYFTGSGTAALATFTTAGRNLVDDADAAAQRTTLGLGTAATQNTGTSGANVPLLDGVNTWSGNQIIQKASANFQIRATSGDGTHYVAAVSGSAATIRWSHWTGSAVSDRWLFGKDSTAESGADAGSNFACYNYTDAGAFKAVTFTMNRADNSVNWYGGLYSNGVTGGSKGAGTLNFGTLYEGGTSLSAKYQPLDSELSAIAGLTSAADRLPYFTGSGTAALATFTTAGRNLVDDADASAQRTTLGLGTAATQNTGTSGTNVPLLDGSNTWSGVQTVTTTAATAAFEVTSSASFAIPFSVVSTNADALGGPGFQFFRNSASPAANDDIGFFNFRGNNSAAAGVNYLQLVGTIIDPTSGSEDSRLRVNVFRAGAQETAFTIKDGVFVGSPTGFAKGVGTLNAVAVYDDSVLLCAPVEFMKSGTVNTAMWDEYAIDETRPERLHEVEETVEIVLDEPVTEIRGQRDGTYKLETITKKKVPVLEAKPVLDDKGQVVGEVKVPKVKRTVTPPQTIKRRNELAHEFKAMLDEGFDPRDPKKYFDKMLADEALPGLKTKANWIPNEESNAKRTNRIILALELQTAAFKTVYEQVEALKAEVAELKKAKK